MSRLDDAFRHFGKASMPGSSTWQDQWDAKKLRFINENCWIAGSTDDEMARMTDEDYESWFLMESK